MITRQVAIGGLLAISLLAGLGLSAFATDDTQVSDAVLAEKVETLLHDDVGLAGSQFRVQNESGVIILGGTVPNEYSLRRALDLVSGVRDVREIRNELEIDFPK